MNPLRARRFAQSMGAKLDLRLVGPRRGALRDLDEVVAARDALVKERTAALNRRGQARLPLVKRQLKNHLAQIDRRIKALDKKAAELIGSDAELSRRSVVLRSIPGVGAVVAASLLAGMPEFGRLDGKAAASLAGVAPRARDSGQRTGRRFIGGGRARPRRLLCMATVSAMRCNPDLKRVHERLTTRGKSAKVALTAVMRKLVVLANVLLKQDRPWTPEPPERASRAPPNGASPRSPPNRLRTPATRQESTRTEPTARRPKTTLDNMNTP